MPAIYRGSDKKENVVIPKPNRRRNQNKQIIFDAKSIHATLHKYIALAYTYTKKTNFIHKGKDMNYNVGISLYNKNYTVNIIGKKSLEYSLKKLYGKGGYLYTFDSKDFTTVKGLGTLEAVAFIPLKPKKIEFIKDPVHEMTKLGVKFNFIDITKK